jgi:hypothetical protein
MDNVARARKHLRYARLGNTSFVDSIVGRGVELWLGLWVQQFTALK